MSPFTYSDSELQELKIDAGISVEEVGDFIIYFRPAGEKWRISNDPKRAHLYDVLAGLVFMAWFPDQKEVFGPLEKLNEYRFLNNGSLENSDADMLRGVLRNVSDPALKARIGDVLWTFKKDHKSARVAISSYMDYARLTDDLEHWPEPVFALMRALAIAKSLGKNAPEINEVLEYIQECVIGADAQDPYFYSNRLIQLLADNEYGDLNQLGSLAERLAVNEENRPEPACERAQQHWQLASDCYHRLGDKDKEHRAIINSAETWVKVAEVELRHPTLARFQISAKYERAIHILRTLPDTQARVNELRHKLLEVQSEAMKQMIPSTISLENNPEALRLREMSIKEVDKEDFFLALIALAKLHFSSSHEYMLEQAREAQERYLLQKLFPKKIVDAFGRTVANPPQTEEEQLLADVFQNQNLLRQSVVGLSIEPARQEVVHAHVFSMNDLALILDGNPLIPFGHEYSVAKGLFAGLQGDFFTSSHMLIP